MKVITNAAWLAVSRASTDALSFVLFAVIARNFGPPGSGEYSYAFAVASLFALLATSGLEEFGIRQYARTSSAERPGLWAHLLTTQGAQLALAVLAFAFLALTQLVHPVRWTVALELSAYLLFWMMARTLFIPAMAAQSMMSPAVTDLCCRLAAILCALVLALTRKFSLPWILLSFPLGGFTLLVLALRNAGRHGAHLRPSKSTAGVLDIARQVAPFAGSDFLGQFYARTDLLLIAHFLGTAQVGIYATDIKFVEVGLLPLFMLGSAAYPLLSRHAAEAPRVFEGCARDLVRIVFFCAGWLATGIFCLVPLLIAPLFGARFVLAARLLPWIALLAVAKGMEAALYRVLYAARRQNVYLFGLAFGTVLIVAFNVLLIPRLGLKGAAIAATLSTLGVAASCTLGLAGQLAPWVVPVTAIRLALALLGTGVVFVGAEHMGAAPWPLAITTCLAYPALGFIAGLIPHPGRSLLFRQPDPAAP